MSTAKKLLDYKNISTVHAPTIAKFIYDLTLKGYEPLPLQCTTQYGNVVITMGLYDKEPEETTQEVTVATVVPTNDPETNESELKLEKVVETDETPEVKTPTKRKATVKDKV